MGQMGQMGQIIRFIEVTREGHFDRTTYQGKTTRFVARDELLERLQELDGRPAISIKPDLDAETIILHPCRVATSLSRSGVEMG